MLEFDIITIFPDMFASVFGQSILKRALEKKYAQIRIHDLRAWSKDEKHKKVDDTPYGGGAGMVMMIEPIFEALQELRRPYSHVILLAAGGEVFTQDKAKSLSEQSHIILLCGHYEGVDQRVSDFLVHEEISIGRYVLTGGELPSMILVDAIIRLLPGVLGNSESLTEESFHQNNEGETYLEYPQYTRPPQFNAWDVPSVLLQGNHEKIKEWRKEHSRRIS